MRTNEENLDLFAELLEPCAEIFTDPEVKENAQKGETRIKAIKAAIKNHKQAVILLLAAIEGIDVDEYIVPPPLQFMRKLLEIINRPDVQELFTLQGLNDIAASSGSASENIEDNDKDGA